MVPLRSPGVGEVVVLATYLERFVSTVRGPIRLDAADAHLEASAGRSTVRLRRVDASWVERSWPELAAVPLSASDRTAVGKVAHAAGSGLHAPILSGVRLGGGWAVASDGYRLARAPLDPAVPACLPPAHLVTRILAEADGEIALGSNGSDVMFVNRDVAWRTPSIEGAYFDWDRLIPPGSATPERLRADRSELLEAVRRVEKVGFANSGAGFTRLLLEERHGGGVVVRAQDAEVGDVWAELDGELTLAPLAFNASYLRDALEQAEGSILHARFADARKPLVVEDDASLQLVMPLRA
ncbi:MAG TPA: DNA polymerase III subunit beta [Acidimicrobiales bacterium]|nr:DNA polymerase III subunit beta [Acidimicrobiales bacterium]